MNAHSSRAMFGRQHLLPSTAFLMFSLVVVCGLTAGTAQSSAQAGVGDGRGSQLPPEFTKTKPEDMEKDFNDDDLKVKGQKPRGKWAFGTGVDKEQFDDASVPVAIGVLQSLSGGGKYAGVVKIKRLQIKNRSPKALNSVQLRWEITYLDDQTKVLLEGTTPFVNFWADPHSAQVVEIPAIYPVLLFKPLAKDGELNGRFMLRIGFQEARFADGSFWRRRGPVIGFNFLYHDPAVADRFPRLATLSPIFPSWWVDPGNSRLIMTPCEAKPRSSASAFSSMPFQEMTCHDDMNVLTDPDTFQNSCGTPFTRNRLLFNL